MRWQTKRADPVHRLMEGADAFFCTGLRQEARWVKTPNSQAVSFTGGKQPAGQTCQSFCLTRVPAHKDSFWEG
eukprot:1876361-Amphidinium_carterae.1